MKIQAERSRPSFQTLVAFLILAALCMALSGCFSAGYIYHEHERQAQSHARFDAGMKGVIKSLHTEEGCTTDSECGCAEDCLD